MNKEYWTDGEEWYLLKVRKKIVPTSHTDGVRVYIATYDTSIFRNRYIFGWKSIYRGNLAYNILECPLKKFKVSSLVNK